VSPSVQNEAGRWALKQLKTGTHYASNGLEKVVYRRKSNAMPVAPLNVRPAEIALPWVKSVLPIRIVRAAQPMRQSNAGKIVFASYRCRNNG
jgi:hypothetical protein